MTETEFVKCFGGVYEHSPWIAQATWRQGLNSQHDTVEGLSMTLARTVDRAAPERQLDLICAHPDLAGRAAVHAQLTQESTDEQASAGIDQCTPDEFEGFQRANREYREKFGFPFVMAVKGSNRHAILAAFEERLRNDDRTELQRALAEIHKIAKLRLQDMSHSDELIT